MEFERQFYLDFPYNQEFDHLPISSSRLMRNFAEKMRRDKLNKYISELSSLVPIIGMATKRMDKTSVLRLSANFLRIHLSLKQNRKPSAPESIKMAQDGLESNLSTILLDSLEGFMLIVTASGKIVYVSDSVEKLLGHSQLDLMGQSLYTICHNGDHELLRHHLQPPSSTLGGDASSSMEDIAEEADKPLVDYVPRSPSFFGGNPEDALSGLAAGERRSFYVRLAERSMARGDPQRHVTVHLIGLLRPPIHKKDSAKGPPGKGKKECSSTTVAGGDEYMLVCVARPFRNKGITELSLMEAVQDEYVTRHLPDGRIIYSDHRIAFVAGYLTEEVMGLSAFHFIHQDDLPWATVANRQMFSSMEGQGYSVYRLRSKTGTLIHLKTRGYLEFNKTTQKVETFVCINTLLTPEEGDKELEKERDRITPFITFQQVTTTSTNGGVHGARSSTTTTTTTNTGNALLSPMQQQQIQQHLQSSSSSSSSSSSASVPPSILSSTSSPVAILAATIAKVSSNRMGLTSSSLSTSSSNSPASYVEVLESSEDKLGDVMMSSPLNERLTTTNTVPNSQTNGDSNTNHHHIDHIDRMMIPISSPQATANLLTSNSTTSPPLELLDTSGNNLLDQYDQMAQDALRLSPPVLMSSNIGGKRIIVTSGQPHGDLPLPRLKRPRSRIFGSLNEVDDLVSATNAKRSLSDVEDLMTSCSSAKRSINHVPNAFISSFSTLHHMSPHLNNKWTPEKTTIIYDQHNNNG